MGKKKGTDISADGSRLVVKKDLGFGQTLALDGLLTGVLGSAENAVEIDLSGVVHLCSSNLAVLAAACNTLVHRGKQVRVLAKSPVARILRLGGLERLAEVKEA